MAAYDGSGTHLLLSAFTGQVFGHLPRADQRAWAQAYLTGLLTTEGKKSVRRIAAAVSGSPTASQSMHQFVNASPWDWVPARAELTRWAEGRLVPRAWVLDVAVLRKRGDHSCGVHRRFVPATGRSVNCQLGIGAFLAAGSQAVPVHWGLLLPGAWVNDEQRRSRARIPDEAGHRTIEQHALDLVDALGESTRLSAPPVVADLSYYTGMSALVRGLSARGRDFVVTLPGRTPVVPVGRPVPRAYMSELPAALEAQRLFDHAHGGYHRIATQDALGGRAERTSVMTALVRLPEVRLARHAPHHTYRLFAVRSYAGRRSPRMWLTNMVHRRTDELTALARLQRRAGSAVLELEADFGLLDFEGRSFPGWHHHMTLVSAASAYSRLELSGVLPGPMGGQA
ncbi:transposase [Streptomyces sp. NBC_01754]|uniref:IS701 family transposase n=1 Tax=Streptomyces sp. NBC_01754 TaxID=2975930 RepID=UPI002DDA7264|nr:transposase [Streptomyces sp. NBC_01754]WSC90969.1 transposase [Streptomyces sp. NBC_01754]WSC96537.1 transposase [Streptomyces sp. NBC_01754]